MYQPLLTDSQWSEGYIPSFGVYESIDQLLIDFPLSKFKEYKEGEIEEPTFLDTLNYNNKVIILFGDFITHERIPIIKRIDAKLIVDKNKALDLGVFIAKNKIFDNYIIPSFRWNWSNQEYDIQLKEDYLEILNYI